ncbi:hypothetical protein JAAARDRAFT_354914 [Jaapia argillacea MUCL 33604]|uniref:Signal recognition particle subunit SRP68 n=1 Tax=Jaapia argillacea MUCL 33604 TaxID=933084 RepID=A0A067PJJ8_9AGAM|nr:hypothetical protein JAAARDRAFT_354914 [Jaapia argillacea MUCL 33604]
MTDSKAPVAFRALQLANEQRTAYGLRYNDFTRYRKHCANRTHRIRSSLKMTHGKGREFKKLPPITQDNIKDGHLQLLLFESERAWAYSQELIASSLQPANENQSSTLRHSATGRFRRAVHWSTELLSHCQALHASSRMSARDLLEATAYTLILNGRFLRYRDEFEDGLIQLSVARSLLDEMASQASTSRDQALATLFADEVGPEIRYCAHELGRSKAYDIDGIVGEISTKHKNELVEGYDALVQKLKRESLDGGKGEAQRRLRDIVWEGEPVPVRNPELVDVILKVQEAETVLDESAGGKSDDAPKGDAKRGKQSHGSRSKRGVAAYDAILLALSDAEDVARKLVEAQQLSGASSTGSVAGTRDIHFLHAYIIYQLLSRRIQRDLLLINALFSSQHAQNARASSMTQKKLSSTKKPQKEQVDARLYPAVVKLLDTILQSLEQMRTLSIVDESPDLATAVEGRILYTRARRSLFLSRCYAAVKKYAESLTLTQQSQLHLRETSTILSTSDSDPISFGTPAFYPLTTDLIDSLEADVALDALQFKNSWFAYNGGSINPESSKAHKKPLFFDIALNYVQLDMDRLQERAGKKSAPPKSAVSTPAPVAPEKKPVTRAKAEEVERAATPEPQAAARGGLTSLLGGWWGRK